MRNDGFESRPAFVGYTPVAVRLHWVVVLLLFIQYILGWTMPAIHRGTQPETLINLHLSFGVLILIALLVRLAWRLTHRPPPPPTGLPGWQNRASALVHGLLYLLLIAIPVLGWMNASARGWAVTLFGVIPLFPLTAEGSAVGRASGDIHATLSYVLLGVAALHVLAALYHRFVLRDEVLRRMLPGQ